MSEAWRTLPTSTPMSDSSAWWRGAVVYQIYPRSFMDSNADGIGDLPGITSRLDHVAELGVDAIWISPFFTSPMKDFGYDIADYRNVDPIFGTLEDFKVLLDTAHSLGLKVIIDQVLSHSSDRHPWFEESRQGRDNARADWYVWADPREDGTPPNNWLSIFGGSAWTWDARRRQYYLHNFLESQPDLNFHNPEVRNAQLDNLRFWLDLGVDGFRLDVVNFYFHSEGLEDNPPSAPGESLQLGLTRDNPYAFQRHHFDISRPENAGFLKDIRALTDRYTGKTTVGEISSDDPIGTLAEYTSGRDKLHMAYTFSLLTDDGTPRQVRDVIRELEARIEDGWPCWAISNHDVQRCTTRWGQGQDTERMARIVVALLCSLRGSICLYQGDELGLPEGHVPFERIQDPCGLPFWPEYKGRDGCRTPMVWNSDAASHGGFSPVEPWLPVDETHLGLAVSEQKGRSDSTLAAITRLLKWRKRQPALLEGEFQLLPARSDMLCWLRLCREQQVLVALNLTGAVQREPLALKPLEIMTGHGFNGRIVGDEIVLEPYDALFAIVAGDGPYPTDTDRQ